MSFHRFEDAMTWAMIHGRENCRPCDRWDIVPVGSEFNVAVSFKTSGKFICYAE